MGERKFRETSFSTAPGHRIVRARNGKLGKKQIVRQLSHPVRTAVRDRVPAVDIGVRAFKGVRTIPI